MEGVSGRGEQSLACTVFSPQVVRRRQSSLEKKLTGYGQSTPVVFGERVFTTSTEGDDSEILVVQCHRLSNGVLMWEKKYPSPAKTKRSQYVSQAAPSPVVDDRAVYLFFESGLLLAMDHHGKELWKRSLIEEYGPMMGDHGLGSLFQTEDGLGLLVDHAGPSYLFCESIRKRARTCGRTKGGSGSHGAPRLWQSPKAKKLFTLVRMALSKRMIFEREEDLDARWD